jgi:hypothetical protein
VQPDNGERMGSGMAKLVVHHDEDPDIGVVLEYVPPGTGRARGWHGECTECGRKIHRWRQDDAVLSAQTHVDRHDR